VRNFRLVATRGWAKVRLAELPYLRRPAPAGGGHETLSGHPGSEHGAGADRELPRQPHELQAFYCQGDSRSGSREPKLYTRSLTYLRCSATNCDGNAFNNNDLAENTSVLYCRIEDCGGCTWEGASRFVRFIGNYVRHSGTIAMGNIGSRAEHLEQLGSGQHIVADNVFEGDTFYAGRSGGFMVRAAHGATQVIIRNNLFVNFASSGIEVAGMADDRHLPAGNVTVAGTSST